MEASHPLNRFVPGTKVEMVGVGEDNTCVQIVYERAGRNAFHRCLGAHRHENRRLNGAMTGMEKARPRTRSGAFGLEFKSQFGHEILRWATRSIVAAGL